ncbi:hypothetical protein E4T56_gene15981 [Termitomyces sp. T112]|nr:hypothetical protein E4T56_gene15981 [Termitomyces sp. T112]
MTSPPLQRRDPRDAGYSLGIGGAWELKLSNIDQTAVAAVAWGMKLKHGHHSGGSFLVIEKDQTYPGVPKLFQCRLPRILQQHPPPPQHIPQLLPWRTLRVGKTVGGCRQCTVVVLSELLAAVVGPLGPMLGEVPAQSSGEMVLASRSRSGMVPGVVRPVPMGLRVVQADVTLEYFAEAAEQARGPLTLEWCQAVALCASCTRRGEQCKFEEPVLGVRWDMSVCLPCCLRHKKCSVTLSWRAACIAAEQGWDHEWVAVQLEEGQRGRVSGRGSGVEGAVGVGWPPMKIGPPWGGRREGAPATRNKGKWRASSLLEVGPSKRAQGEPAMAGPPGPTVYSPTSGALVEQSAGGSWSITKAILQRQAEELERLLATCREEVRRVGEERDGFWRELDEAWKEWDLARRDKDIAVGTATEQLLQLQELQACMRLLEAWGEAAGQQTEGLGMRGTQWGPSAEATQATVERARRQEEWLANEAALGWEHCILLDGVSAALGSIHDGLARMPGDLPPELGQGVMQMGRLLAGHRQRATADPGAWWEVVVDMAEPLPGHPEVLVMVVAQLKVDLVGRIAEVDSGGGEGE